MINCTLVERGYDPMGSGAYGAPRGAKTHKGIDYCAVKGAGIHSNTDGTVTKLGYAYASDLSFRYVEVTALDDTRHRFFYVYPACKVGDKIEPGDVIGFAQDIAGKWKGGMKNHIHYEILLAGANKASIDPKEYWK